MLENVRSRKDGERSLAKSREVPERVHTCPHWATGVPVAVAVVEVVLVVDVAVFVGVLVAVTVEVIGPVEQGEPVKRML